MRYLASPFNGLTELNRELDRIFNGQRLLGHHSIEDDLNWARKVDVSESDESFQIVADMPGVNPNDIEISLNDGLLTIKGQSKTPQNNKENNFIRKERQSRSFFRQFTLPESINAETVSAKSAHGVLTVSIPKTTPPQPIKVAVEIA